MVLSIILQHFFGIQRFQAQIYGLFRASGLRASRALRVDSEISRWNLLAVGAGWFSGLLIYDTVNLKTLDPQTLQP